MSGKVLIGKGSKFNYSWDQYSSSQWKKNSNNKRHTTFFVRINCDEFLENVLSLWEKNHKPQKKNLHQFKKMSRKMIGKRCGMKLCIGNVTGKPVVKNYSFNYLSCKIKGKDLLNMRGCYDRACGEVWWLGIIIFSQLQSDSYQSKDN